jgi:hypothetical protein
MRFYPIKNFDKEIIITNYLNPELSTQKLIHISQSELLLTIDFINLILISYPSLNY